MRKIEEPNSFHSCGYAHQYLLYSKTENKSNKIIHLKIINPLCVNIHYEKVVFSKTTRFSEKNGTVLHFANISSIWLNRRQLDPHSCSAFNLLWYVALDETYEENLAQLHIHRYIVRKGKTPENVFGTRRGSLYHTLRTAGPK